MDPGDGYPCRVVPEGVVEGAVTESEFSEPLGPRSQRETHKWSKNKGGRLLNEPGVTNVHDPLRFLVTSRPGKGDLTPVTTRKPRGC